MVVSVDTWTGTVARAAAEAGTHILNDVSAGSDPLLVRVAAQRRLPLIIMHMRGQPTRHREVDQRYDDVGAEVRAFLTERAEALTAAGVSELWLDPGFQFGKSAADNLRMLDDLPTLLAMGRPVVVSASRKGFLSELLGKGYGQQAAGLVPATVAFNVLAAAAGAHIARVHDVAEVAAALRVVNAVRIGRRGDAGPVAVPRPTTISCIRNEEAMPFYVFACKNGHEFERRMTMEEFDQGKQVRCPECQTKGTRQPVRFPGEQQHPDADTHGTQQALEVDPVVIRRG